MLLSCTKIQTAWKVSMCLLLSWIPNKLAFQQMASCKSDDSVQGKMASLEGCHEENLWGVKRCSKINFNCTSHSMDFRVHMRSDYIFE